jgi:DNA-binding transcriptional MerR regulator
MMQIGDLAAKAGITTRTIRYYEELGIIEPEKRSHGGFRLYSENQLRRLNIVQNLKALGFELERARELFNLKDSCGTGSEIASAMIELLSEQQEEIDRKISSYLEMKERNAQAIGILKGCLCCSIKVFERDCRNCEVYRRHAAVPDIVECSVYQV